LCGQVPPDPTAGIRHLNGPTEASVSVDWLTYVSALRNKNQQRLDWIAGHLPEVTAIVLGDWQSISKPSAEKLLGITAGYGGLGRLIGAGVVKNIFFESSWKNLQTRKKIRSALES